MAEILLISIGPDIQAMMDHGIKYEIHGIHTLVGQIMPLLLPPCHAFFEVGCLVSDLDSIHNFIAVSPDGMIECTQGNDTCKHKSIRRHKHIMVELKSPCPQEHLPDKPYYEVPTRHVPQLLCQMYFFKSDELWIICVLLLYILTMSCSRRCYILLKICMAKPK